MHFSSVVFLMLSICRPLSWQRSLAFTLVNCKNITNYRYTKCRYSYPFHDAHVGFRATFKIIWLFRFSVGCERTCRYFQVFLDQSYRRAFWVQVKLVLFVSISEKRVETTVRNPSSFPCRWIRTHPPFTALSDFHLS